MPLEIRYPSPLEETEIQSIARAIFDQPDDDLDFEHDDALIAWLDGQAVGFAMRFERKFHPHLSTLEIAVLPEFRRSGIGTAFWQELKNAALERHWQKPREESFHRLMSRAISLGDEFFPWLLCTVCNASRVRCGQGCS